MTLDELVALGAYSVSGTLLLNGFSIAKKFTVDGIELTEDGQRMVAEMQSALSAEPVKKTRKKAEPVADQAPEEPTAE